MLFIHHCSTMDTLFFSPHLSITRLLLQLFLSYFVILIQFKEPPTQAFSNSLYLFALWRPRTMPIREALRNPRWGFVDFTKVQTNHSKLRGFLFKSSMRSDGVGRINVGVGNKDGVIIVDHGSRRQESNLMLSKFNFMNFYFIVQISHNYYLTWVFFSN